MSSQAVTTVALLADPDAPTEIAHRVAQELPERLSERAGEGREFDVHVVSEPFTAGAEDPATLRRRVLERGREEDWDVVVALTDLPLHTHGRKLAVDLDHEHGMAVLSLPSLGGLGFQRRARRAVEDAVLNLTQAQAAGAGGTPRREPLLTFVGRLAPIHRSRADDDEAVDLRYVVTGPRGYLRLLLGMVRANRPWRLVPGLSKALATALATGAIATVNATVWSLAGTLSTVRLVIATVGSIVLMVGWLIVDAGLWHRTTDASPEARQRDALYNASTVVTLGLGVLVCYVGLMTVNLLWALFILNDRVYASVTRTPLDGGQYWTLAWFVASVATVGGALGSSLESDEAIRTAAYSKREQERRRMLRDEREATNADSTGRSSSPGGAPKGRGELRDQPPTGRTRAYDRAGHGAVSEARRKIAAETQSHATSHTRPFSVKSYARVSGPWRAVRKPKDRWPPAATAAL